MQAKPNRLTWTRTPNWRVVTIDGHVLDEGELATFKQARLAALDRARILGERVLVRRFREGWEDYCIVLPSEFIKRFDSEEACLAYVKKSRVVQGA
jgi:hypothetical protein